MLKIIFYLMGILLGISILAKLISAITMRKMVKEAAEIQKSNHKLMKLIKAKFEHASMVSDRVQNVGAFVDKYLYEYKICGIRLNTWRGIPQKGLFMILILGVFAICESIRAEGLADVTVEYIQWTGIFVLFFLLLQAVSAEKTRLQAVRNYMVEYLENVCIHRYAKKHNMSEDQISEFVQEETMSVHHDSEEVLVTTNEIQEAVKDALTQESEEGDQEQPTLQIVDKISEEEERSQQEMRIRAILEEFLA